METPKELLVKFDGKLINVSVFRKRHPGGSNLLDNFSEKEVKNVMEATNHGYLAYKILDSFDSNTKFKDPIDWSKPVNDQVTKLGKQYWEWYKVPIQHKFRLYDSDFIETLITTTWQQFIACWLPMIVVFIIGAHHRIASTTPEYTITYKTSIQVAMYTGIGFMVWPLFEYLFHRFLFHWSVPEHQKDSPFWIRLHFNLHGIHHKAPYDTTRLLFPPIPASVLATGVYSIYYSIFGIGGADAAIAGSMMSYFCYDLIHYYLHHGSPKPGTRLQYLKRYHNMHHFKNETLGFGIASVFYDKLFNTTIKVDDIPYTLSWD